MLTNSCKTLVRHRFHFIFYISDEKTFTCDPDTSQISRMASENGIPEDAKCSNRHQFTLEESSCDEIEGTKKESGTTNQKVILCL